MRNGSNRSAPRAAATALAVSTLWLLAPSASADKGWQQTFVQNVMDQSSDTRWKAIESVEPNDKGAVHALFAILKQRDMAKMDWYLRTAGIDKLSQVTDEKNKAEILRALNPKERDSTYNDPLSREAAILALAKMHDDKAEEKIASYIDDKDGNVRRAVLHAMAEFKNIKRMNPVLARWGKATKAMDFREDYLCWQACQAMCEIEKARNFEDWKSWWTTNGPTYKKPSEMTDDEREAAQKKAAQDATEQRKKEDVTTSLRDMPITFTVSGQGEIPLLVIPDDSWNPHYMEPFLSQLEDICRIFIVELPAVTKLDKSKLKMDINIPYYPYEQLCDAFEEIRKQYAKDRFAVLAHGFSTMIAERYLTKYGENCSHAILVGCFPGDDAYGNMLDKLQAKANNAWKDKELSHAIGYLWITDSKTLKKFYQPKTDEEHVALERKFFSVQFANPQDPEIDEIWERCKKATNLSLKAADAEQSESPPWDITHEKKQTLPVLVISGGKSEWFKEVDGARVAANYPNAKHVVLKDAAMMPWFDDPVGFQSAVREFFTKNPYKKK